MSISRDIDIEIECQYLLFGCVRYSNLDKILSLNVKCCLDVIKAKFRDIVISMDISSKSNREHIYCIVWVALVHARIKLTLETHRYQH